MKLWLIRQEFNNGNDTYDSAVVAAESENEAKAMHPGGGIYESSGTWAAPEHVEVEYIGEAKPGLSAGVMVASFNAG